MARHFPLVAGRHRAVEGRLDFWDAERGHQLSVGDVTDAVFEVLRIDRHVMPFGKLEPEIERAAVALSHLLMAKRAVPSTVLLVGRVLERDGLAGPIQRVRGDG